LSGFQFIEVSGDADCPALEGAVWYPCREPLGEIDLGEVTATFAITVTGAKNGPISGDKLPLVVVSPGRRSHFALHHDTAEMLADAGFVVAVINHPGDTYFDQSRSDDRSAWGVERPSDIKQLVDFMLGASPLASNIDRQRIGFYGFSRGGYTGLVLIGANPDWAAAKEFPTPPLAHDPRIKAAVIADPFAVFFTADSLASVTTPVQLWASEHGGDGVTLESVAAVDRNLSSKHEYHVVPNSGHFAFLIPCPPALAKAVPEVCTDAPGFDRAAFHEQFNADVLAFFRKHLGQARP
jgi:predicted dienelactone hydrolase